MPRSDDYHLSYGCVCVEKESLRQVLNAAQIVSVNIFADGKIITVDKQKLRQIKDFLNKGE